MKKSKTNSLTTSAMIAAIYCALGIVLSPVSFAVVQVRAAEALTLLCVFSPECIWGVTLGCAMTNTIGVMMGTNILGVSDILFGTMATFIAGIITFALRNIKVNDIPLLSALPPVVINSLVIGMELSFASTGKVFSGAFIVCAGGVAIGELVSCGLLGLLLVFIVKKTGIEQRLFKTD